MEFTSRLKDVQADYMSKSVVISFETADMTILSEIDKLKGVNLTVKADKYHVKRSLDANSYLWLLCTKIAKEMNSSKEEIYEEMLQKYGYIYENENGVITITVKADVNMNNITGHWKLYRESSDSKWKSYMMIKGTSEYNTKEMSHFLDMVVEDAKELGIETLTPSEIERLKATWKAQ